jgi:hypothetical protein
MCLLFPPEVAQISASTLRNFVSKWMFVYSIKGNRSQRSTAGGRKGYISMPPKRNKNDFITTGDGDFSSFVQGLPIDMDNFVHVDLKGSTPLVQEVIIESKKLIIQTKVVGYVQRNTRKMYLNMLQFANK